MTILAGSSRSFIMAPTSTAFPARPRITSCRTPRRRVRTLEAVGASVETVDMSELVTRQAPQIRAGGGGGGRPAEGFGDFGRGERFPPGHARRVYRTGMYLALVGISMLFIAFTSAYIVRSGLGDDWVAIGLPSLLWWN